MLVLCLTLENANNEAKDVCRIETLLNTPELAKFDQLFIENVIDKADEHIIRRNHYLDHALLALGQNRFHQALEKHELRHEGLMDFVGKLFWTQKLRCVFLLLF